MSILQTILAIFQSKSISAAARTSTAPADPQVEPVRASTPVENLVSEMRYYDGYVRESALHRAAALASPELLPAIAERLNDWVPQVRTLAQKVLLGMVSVIDTREALRLLPAVQRLHQAGRADHSDWIASFEQALVKKISPQIIIDGLLDPDVHVARACWKLVEAWRLVPPEAAIARLLPATPDIVLARYAVETIFRLPEQVREPLFERALESSFGMVRAIALRPLLTKESTENDALAIRMATDLQAWVRMIASGYLKRRGIDVAAVLAETLQAAGANSMTMRGCLAGLAEQGSTDRLDLVRSFTRHPMARVQLSAYFAWLRLEPSRRDEIALDVLHSPHRRVRKLVLQLVHEEGVYVDAETALYLMAEHDDVDMMFAFLQSDPWASLELIVQMEPQSRQHPALRARLEREFEAWFAASMRFTAASPAQRARFQDGDIVKVLAGLASMDEQKVMRRLTFLLGVP